MTDLPDKRPDTPEPLQSTQSSSYPEDRDSLGGYTDESRAAFEPEQTGAPAEDLDEPNDAGEETGSDELLAQPAGEDCDPDASGDAAIASDEALHDAIDTLESMLADHGIADSAGELSKDNSHASTETDRAAPVLIEEADGQFTIPLLNEVVAPGAEASGLAEPIRAILPDMDDLGDSGYADSRAVDYDGGSGHDGRYIGGEDIELTEGDYEADLYSHLIARLKSEIEVIVQGEIESIVKDAAKRVTRKVDTHVQIVLPEILDEIALVLSERNRKR